MLPNNTFPFFVDEEKINSMVEEYQSPLLVFNESVIREKYQALKKVLDSLYSKTQIAYSVKTNYIPSLISLLKECGAYAEVVSGFEYWLAKKLNFTPNEIVFNGPEKSLEDIEDAVTNEVLLNINSFSELKSFVSLNFKNKEIKVGIRVNTNIRSFSQKRFGFHLESGEAFKAIAEIKKKQPQCRIAGLHTHLGMMVRHPEHFGKIAELLSDCAITIEREWGDKIEYLDFGGGFSVPGAKSRRRIAWDVPDISVYIKNITDVLHEKFPKDKPLLILEPGRYLIDEAGMFVTTVIDSKFVELPQRKRNSFFDLLVGKLRKKSKNTNFIQIVTVDSSSISVLRAPSNNKHLYLISKNNHLNKKGHPSYVVGNSCMTNDYLTNQVTLPLLEKGDKILFRNAGAYTISMSEQFIHPRPAVVLVKESGLVECIQKREGYKDMIHLSICS